LGGCFGVWELKWDVVQHGLIAWSCRSLRVLFYYAKFICFSTICYL